MKKLNYAVLIFLFGLLPLCGYAQHADTLQHHEHHHENAEKIEVGVNTTFLIKQFLNFSNNNNIAISPYSVTFKYFWDGQNGIRSGAGFNILTKSSTSTVGSTDPKAVDSLSLDLRVGYEHKWTEMRRWKFSLGADFLFGLHNSRVENANFNQLINYNNTYSMGVGPAMGVRFDISRRISLGTETAAYLQYSYNSISFESIDNTFTPESNHVKTLKFNLVLPTTLYFIIRF